MSIIVPPGIDSDSREIIQNYLTILGTRSPSLEQIWQCIDLTWEDIGCDNRIFDEEKYSEFYSHPVWLLNGLFIEQHAESLKYREEFTDWVLCQNAHRVADIGGGFGTLSRMIAAKNPEIEIDVIEPHPNRIALEFAKKHENLSYKQELDGEYDLLLATDVFEHIPDPLNLIERTSAHLKFNGKYLIANCFHPVIQCHLPCTFHFRYSWSFILSKINLAQVAKVSYGTVFKKTGNVLSSRARLLELLSRSLFPVFQFTSRMNRKLKT